MTPSVTLPAVREMMTTRILALSTEDTILDALSFFNKHRISMAPVIEKTDLEKNGDKKVVGVMTQDHLMQHLSSEIFHDEFYPPTLDKIMIKDMPFALESWDVFELENFLHRIKLDNALVRNSEGRLVGIVSRRDIMVTLEEVAVGYMDYKKNLKEPVELTKAEQVLLQFDFKGAR